MWPTVVRVCPWASAKQFSTASTVRRIAGERPYEGVDWAWRSVGASWRHTADGFGWRTGRAVAASSASRSPCPQCTPRNLEDRHNMVPLVEEARMDNALRNHTKGPLILLVDDDQ